MSLHTIAAGLEKALISEKRFFGRLFRFICFKVQIDAREHFAFINVRQFK